MRQPLIHHYNPETEQYDVREMTDEELAAYEAEQANPRWIGDMKE